MTTLSDNFAVDTGQITSFLPNVTSGGSPWIAGGTVGISAGQLIFTAPAASSFSVIGGNTAYENSWTISVPDLFITTLLGSPTWQLPAPSGQINFGCGIVEDASNCVMLTLGPETSPSSLSVFLYAIIGGVASGTSAIGTIPITVLPDGIGFGLQNNIVTFYLLFSGVWQQVTTIGTGGNIDVSGIYDFTAPGALVGWRPGFIFAQSNNNAVSTIAAAEIQYTTPFTTPVLPDRQVYGKFAPAKVFIPTLLIDAKGIKPRIYMPKENVTVET